jgi:glutathione S-transferase
MRPGQQVECISTCHCKIRVLKFIRQQAQLYFEMIELIQFPWSPFCIVQRRILEFAGVRFKTTNLPRTGDRSLVWKLTKQRYYGVPIIRDGRNVVFEISDDSQDIAKYLDWKLKLGLFPAEIEGVQFLLWRYIENDIEGVGFKLNDVYFKEFVKPDDQLPFIRHKERKFGRGCIDQWRAQQKEMLKQLEQGLLPFEEMLAHHAFLLGARPRFVDFNLYGMLGNFLFSGRYKLPPAHPQIRKWYRRMSSMKNE